MDIHKIKEAETELRKSDELDSWLKYFSIHTWNKIGFARERNGLKMHETTITQDFVFELWVALEQHKWSITMFEATSESTNGNDLEILVCTKKGYIFLACQAKILYKSDKYKAITHQVESKPKGKPITQAGLLIEYAEQKQGIPIYLFYNFCKDEEDLNQVKDQIGTTYEIENLGCSVAFATDIKKEYYDNRKSGWKIPSFKDIHPKFAEPLNQFIRNLLDTDGKTILCNQIPFSSTFKFYTVEQVNQDKDWSLISTKEEKQPEKKAKKTKEAKMDIDNTNDVTESNKLSSIKFKPKFRVVLNCKNS
jgi:hypothetical protein